MQDRLAVPLRAAIDFRKRQRRIVNARARRVPGRQRDQVRIETRQLKAQRLRRGSADRARETESSSVNGAEGRRTNMLAPLRGDRRLPRDQRGDVLIADLGRRNGADKKAKAEGRRKDTLRPCIPYHYPRSRHATRQTQRIPLPPARSGANATDFFIAGLTLRTC